MVGHRRVAALAAALLLVFLIPGAAQPGVASAVQPNPPAWPTQTLSGVAFGLDGGSVAGGSVSACGTGWGCFSATIDGSGSFAIPVGSPGVYTVSIAPPVPYAAGWYAAWDVHAFTTDANQATQVIVNGQDVSLLPMLLPHAYVPPPPTYGSISGYVVGAYSGSLAGGTVTACDAGWSCASATIASDGYYWIGYLWSGTYTVSITPLLGSPYLAGYYASWASGHFTTDVSLASSVNVWSSNVVLPTIVVPAYAPTYGSISGYVVGAYSGSLAGGTVTACAISWPCASATIQWNGAYWIGSLPSGTYTVSITPPTSAYLSGFYAAGWTGNFATSASSATPVNVWSSNVSLPTIVVPAYVAPTYGSISGYAVGVSSGSLTGGTVTACTASLSCATATIGSAGYYWIGSLPAGTYTLRITPLTGSGYASGYYASGSSGNFTTSASSATAFSVWNTNIVVPTITVPLSTGGIVVPVPKTYVVWAYLRPEYSSGTSTSLRIAEGSRAELASRIDPSLSGMRVDVWRKLAGKSWVLITTRGISGEGWVIYRFTATAGTNGAQYRFHLPSTSLTVSVWSVARTVRLL